MGEVLTTGTLIDRLNTVRGLFGNVIAELEHASGLMEPGEILAAADGIESVSRQAGYAQLLAASSIETRVFAEGQSLDRSEFRNCAEFLQARLRIGRSEARRRLSLGHAVLPRKSLTGEPVDAKYRLFGSLAAHAVASLPALGLAVAALDTAAVKTLSNLEQAEISEPAVGDSETGGQTALTARARTLEMMEASLAQAMTEQDPDFLTPLIRRWNTLIDQDGTLPNENELRHRQGLFRRETRRGLSRFELWADQLQTETLLTVIHAGNNPRARNDHAQALDSRSLQQRQLDVLVDALGSALRNRDLPRSGGQAAQLTVTIDYASLAAQLRGVQAATAQNSGSPRVGSTGADTQPIGQRGDQFVEQFDEPPGIRSAGLPASGVRLSDGQLPAGRHRASMQFTGPVHATQLRRLACEAGIIPIVLAGNGEVLDVGRKQRLFTTAQRAALTARDKGCAFPGCSIPASWCEAHHIEPWQSGGVTSLANGTLLCSHHHHLIHRGHWQIDRSRLDSSQRDQPKLNPPGQRLEAEDRQPQDLEFQGEHPQTRESEKNNESENLGTGNLQSESGPVENQVHLRTTQAFSPWFIPPRWIDPHQTPQQNQFHHL